MLQWNGMKAFCNTVCHFFGFHTLGNGLTVHVIGTGQVMDELTELTCRFNEIRSI